jgi:hypothetical protein
MSLDKNLEGGGGGEERVAFSKKNRKGKRILFYKSHVLNSIVACNIKITGYCYDLVNFINFFLSKAVY